LANTVRAVSAADAMPISSYRLAAFRRVAGMHSVLNRATRIALQSGDHALGDLGIRDGKWIPTAITEVDRLQ
jgi:hypothetical protein